MQKILLDMHQIQELVLENRYKIDTSTKFISRCIDGRYFNDPTPPALAFPGADAGELALLFATANTFGFQYDAAKAQTTLLETIGGERNFRMHTDEHGDKTTAASGCGHMKQIRLDPKAYDLTPEQIDILNTQVADLKSKGAQDVLLRGDHMEGAVLVINGPYGVLPQYDLHLDGKRFHTQVFIYHQSLVNERHREWAKKMVESEAVTLHDNCDAEYLYEVMSDTADTHLFETAKRLALGSPIYAVTFKEDGSFDIKDMGKVQGIHESIQN